MHPRAAKMRFDNLKVTFQEQVDSLAGEIAREEDPARRLLRQAEIGVLVDRFVLDLDTILPFLQIKSKKMRPGQPGPGATSAGKQAVKTMSL